MWPRLIFIWLVVEPPLWKIWKSVGIIIPNMWKHIQMFQTTNQLYLVGATLLNFNFTSRLCNGYGRWPGVPALFDAYNKLSLPDVRHCKLEVQVRIMTVNGKQKKL